MIATHRLIMIEAHEVQKETGLTPRQLAGLNSELLASLKVMTGLCTVKYGNLDEDVFQEIQKACAIISKAEAAQ